MQPKSIQMINLILFLYIQSFQFIHSLSQLYPSYKQPQTNIQYIPSDISVFNVSHSYPNTLFRTLFSSVPKREYALQDINISFGNNNNNNNNNYINDKNHNDIIDKRIVLLIGASSSGKSTLLRLLSGIETPTNGNILLNPLYAKPIIVDSKLSITDNNDSKSVLTWIQQSSGLYDPKKEVIIQQCSYEIAKRITLNDDQLQGKPSQLTPSGQYLFALACACVQSIFHNFDKCYKDVNLPINTEDEQTIELHCPILLLDELLDNEHSIVTQQVFKGLQQLTNMGGIVISVTHKPNAVLQQLIELKNKDKHFPKRVITLSAGKILTDQSII